MLNVPYSIQSKPNPTWGNHIPIFTNAGLEVRKYRYYDNEKCSLDFDHLIEDMESMPEGSCILLHACAHNPTGSVVPEVLHIVMFDQEVG